MAGAAERLLIGVVLYTWLRRVFGRVPALVASVATVILSAADCTDPIASYNHDAILWAMASGWLAGRLLEGDRPRVRADLTAVAAGVCAGLSILTKQTVGLASAVAVVLCLGVYLWRRCGARVTVERLVFFGCGCALPVGPLLLVLARLHLVGDMLRMLFVAGPQAKAPHAIDFVTREFRVAWDNAGWVVLGGAARAGAGLAADRARAAVGRWGCR